jgi:hypothetical protein
MKIREVIVESAGLAQQWIDQVYSQYPKWPYGQADRVMVWGEGEEQTFAAFKLKPGADARTVEIDWIMAGPEQRQGVGSRAIQELQRQAQASGIRLTLMPWSHGRISSASLTKLYKRHGFKPIARGAKPMAWEPIMEGGNVFKGRTGKISLENIEPTLTAYFNELKSIFPQKAAIFDRQHFHSVGSSSLEVKGLVPSRKELPLEYKGQANKDVFKTEDTGHFWVFRNTPDEPWMDLGPKEAGDIDLAVSSHSIVDQEITPKSITEWGLDPDAVTKQFEIFKSKAKTATPQQILMRAFLQELVRYINANAPTLYCDEKKVNDGNIFGVYPQVNPAGKYVGTGVQIDWMVGNLEWLLFSYHSAPYAHYSNVKGLHRTQLMLSAFQVANLSFNHVSGVKDKESRDVVAHIPDKALKILGDRLGFEINRDDTEDYYKLHRLFKMRMNTQQYNSLLNIYFKILDSTRADIPDDLQNEWIKRQKTLGLSGKFLPNTSALAKYRTETT